MLATRLEALTNHRVTGPAALHQRENLVFELVSPAAIVAGPPGVAPAAARTIPATT